MYKRFTDCHKWHDPWFRKLPSEYKNLWSYICDNCDNAGVWKVDMETASFFIGTAVDSEEALKFFDGRITVIREGYWYISSFIPFQFKRLSRSSPLHASVFNLLEKHDIDPAPLELEERRRKAFVKPFVRLEVKEEVKVKEKVIEVKRFTVPTAEEVTAYAFTIGFKLNGSQFVDYYTSRGWKIGHTAIKDWKACVRTWKRKHTEDNNAPNGSQSSFSYIAHARAKREAEKSGSQTP